MTDKKIPLVERVINDFKYHKPDTVKVAKHEAIRAGGLDYAQSLISQCPESRELSLALTSLEEAVMWANAAIARNS